MPDVLDKSVMKALSSDTRQGILKLLANRPYTASELAKLLDKHVTTIAEHVQSLEKSQLIARKDNGNKWIYYALTPQGEKMFKPRYYSWTIMLVLSVVAVVAGLGNFFSSYGQRAISEASKSIPVAISTDAASAGTTVAADYTIIFSVALVALGIIGMTLYLWKKNLQGMAL